VIEELYVALREDYEPEIAYELRSSGMVSGVNNFLTTVTK